MNELSAPSPDRDRERDPARPRARRVLHVATYVVPDKFGGAERVIHDLAAAQAARGDDVTVLTANHDSRPAREQVDGFDLRRYPLPPGRRGFRFFRAVHRSCRQALDDLRTQPFDVLHAHQVASAVAALDARRVARRRVFSFYAPYSAEFAVERGAADAASPQGLGLIDRWKRAGTILLDRRCLERADRVVVLSEFSRSQIAALCRRALSKTVRIAPGVDTARFRPGAAAEARSRLSLPSDRRLLLTVRRLTRRMGIDALLRALHLLRGDAADALLLIAGTGPLESELRALAASLGLAERVRFLGRVADEDLPALYRAADLFVLPTQALEGFGMVTLEALACGTPVIGTAVGATGEVLQALTPFTPPVAPDPPSIAAGIDRALAGPAAKDAAVRAAARIDREYTWSRVAERVDRVYEELLSG